MNNLAGTIAAQGDLAGARALLDEAIETLHREFGPNDPDALTALANLAALLWQHGDRSEAYWLQQQVVECGGRRLARRMPAPAPQSPFSRRCTGTGCRNPRWRAQPGRHLDVCSFDINEA